MKPRRHGLRVETFPFLAVLLCAMGSLILLLLVMDRRAKAVARAKTLRKAAELVARHDEDGAARRAEWERRRQALHDQLAAEDRAVLDRLHGLRQDVDQATSRFGREENESRLLEQRLRAGKARLAALAAELTGQQQSVRRTAAQAQAAQDEASRLTASLEQLERTLAEVKAERKRQAETYSLVPYRGKHGDNRRPIYVECTADGVVLHPERTQVAASRLAGPDVRKEIERRLESRPSGDKPYLLMLVRPEGIVNYYAVLAGLQGLKAEYGYEFVDSAWVLDFAEERTTPQPWTAARAPLVDESSNPAGPTRPRPRGMFPGDRPRSAPGVLTSNTGGPGGTGESPTGWSAAPAGQAAGGPGGSAQAVGGSGGSAPARAGGRTPGGPPGEPGAGAGPIAAASPSRPRGDVDVPFTPAATPAGSAAGGGVPALLPLPGDGAAGAGASTAPAGAARGGEKPSGGNGGQASGTDTKGQGGPPGDGGPSAPGSGPRAPDGEKRRTAAPRLVLYGNRDWFIPIECRADGLRIQLTGETFALAVLSTDEGRSALHSAVEQMIARRQASVRPGEPPYRPMVRFRVRSDGLRAYYLAYPALEPLHVPMSREDVPKEAKEP